MPRRASEGGAAPSWRCRRRNLRTRAGAGVGASAELDERRRTWVELRRREIDARGQPEPSRLDTSQRACTHPTFLIALGFLRLSPFRFS